MCIYKDILDFINVIGTYGSPVQVGAGAARCLAEAVALGAALRVRRLQVEILVAAHVTSL